MKITSSFGIEHYKNVAKAQKKDNSFSSKLGAAGKDSAAKTDKVAFSSDAANKTELARLALAQSRDVEAAASSERISSLQQSVNDGTYFVEADVLADKILDRLV